MIALGDLASVKRGYVDPPRTMMRSSGISCLGLAISMREGGNITTLGEQVQEKIRYLQTMYPIGVEFDTVAFQPGNVQRKVDGFIMNLIQAIAIVMAVMLLTLGFRSGLIVASLIPMAILMAIIFMGIFEIGIDQISLAALIIALGMLVDNAIVMSEANMVRREQGESAKEAAINAAKELTVPLLTSSLTTCAAFLPFYLAKSSMGEYVGALFQVVTITLLCSWALSLSMIPLLCVFFLKVKTKSGKEGFDSWFYKSYRSMILFMLKRRLLAIVAVGAIFWLAMIGLGFVPSIFMPVDDTAVMTAELSLPVGTPIEKTVKMIDELEAYIKENLMASEESEGILNWGTFIGQGAPRFKLTYNPPSKSPEFGMLLINASSFDNMIETIVPSIERYCLEHFPDVLPTVQGLATGAGSKYPIDIRVSGKETEQVFALVEQVKAKLNSLDGTKNTTDDWGIQTKKLLVDIDQARARRAGVSSQDIAVSLKTNLSGLETTQYREETNVIPVILRSISAQRTDIGKIESLNVFSSNTGASVPLMQVADLDVVWQSSKILRRNRLKTVSVQADVNQGTSAMAVTGIMKSWLESESRNWEIGYGYEIGGESESSATATQSIVDQLPLAGFLIVFLLVFQFNSLRRPLIILITIPFSIIGVTFGLLVAQSYFGFMTLLGLVSLAGIVINNAIVLLDRINIEREENGLEPQQAVVEAVQQRLRPILLTTLTTVGGLIPLWLSGGPMWEPMAIAIIFGIMFATVLTLGMVPVLYSLFFRVSFKGYAYKNLP